jgi:hypothetical protein
MNLKLNYIIPLLSILFPLLEYSLGAPSPLPVLDKAPEHYPEASGKTAHKFSHWLNRAFGK